MKQKKENKMITTEIIEDKKQYEKIKETRASFLNIFLKIEKPLARIIERKKREYQNKYNQKWKRRNYDQYHRNTITKEHNYTPKLDNLEEMTELLETNNRL